MTEAELEKICTDMVIEAGGEHRKLDTGMNAKGQLDHAYWLHYGVHFIVEYKLPGEDLSPKQEARVARLRSLGHTVYIVRTVEAFRRLPLLRAGLLPNHPIFAPGNPVTR